MTVDELLALLDEFPWDEYAARLGPELQTTYRDVLEIGGAAGARAVAGAQWNPSDPFLDRFATRYVGERVRQLTGTTREEVAALVRTAFADGSLPVQELATKIHDTVRERFSDYERYRALAIARTETAIAYNHGNALGFVQAGVDEVDIRDGTGDALCAAANGQRWTVQRWLSDPIAHPNCERSGSAVLDKDDDPPPTRAETEAADRRIAELPRSGLVGRPKTDVSAEKVFGHRPVTAADVEGAFAREARIGRVPLSSLVPTQSVMNRAVLRANVDVVGSGRARPIVLRLADGSWQIKDGHHRLAALKMMGRASAKVDIRDALDAHGWRCVEVHSVIGEAERLAELCALASEVILLTDDPLGRPLEEAREA